MFTLPHADALDERAGLDPDLIMSKDVLAQRLQRVEQWREEWAGSDQLRNRFPELATYLVFRASECEEFRWGRSRLARKRALSAPLN